MGAGMGRRRERDQVAEVARRRLALLEAELAGIRPQVGVDPGWVDPHEAAPQRPVPREPGQHRQPAAHREARREAQQEPQRAGRPAPPPTGQRPPLRPGRPGSLHDPVELEEEEQVPDPVDHTDGLPDWLADRLPATLRGRAVLSGRAAVAVAVVVLALLGVVGWVTLRPGGGDAVPQAQVRTVAGAASASAVPSGSPPVTTTGGSAAPPAPGAAGASAAPATAGDVVVDVAGKVRRPGIVTLPTGSRVHQAIQRAGGARPGVSLTSINLARVLVDGEQIVVGAKGVAAAPATGATGTTGTAAGPGGGTAGALVNLNTADAAALDTLPGVGEVTAQKILDWRTSHGTFTSVDQLLDVDGIGDKTLADIKPHVTV